MEQLRSQSAQSKSLKRILGVENKLFDLVRSKNKVA